MPERFLKNVKKILIDRLDYICVPNHPRTCLVVVAPLLLPRPCYSAPRLVVRHAVEDFHTDFG